MARRIIGVAAAALCLMAAQAAPRVVSLTQQPGTPLEATARKLVARDLAEAARKGDTPLLLVGTASVDGGHLPPAIFVQIQSAQLCGSAGCETNVFLHTRRGWRKVLDSISGPITVDPRMHRGMHDLLIHGHDRWVWNGQTYIDTLPTPKINLHPTGPNSAG